MKKYLVIIEGVFGSGDCVEKTFLLNEEEFETLKKEYKAFLKRRELYQTQEDPMCFDNDIFDIHTYLYGLTDEEDRLSLDFWMRTPYIKNIGWEACGRGDLKSVKFITTEDEQLTEL